LVEASPLMSPWVNTLGVEVSGRLQTNPSKASHSGQTKTSTSKDAGQEHSRQREFLVFWGATATNPVRPLTNFWAESIPDYAY
jgi:hypothetical protein